MVAAGGVLFSRISGWFVPYTCSTPGSTPVPLEFRLQTAADVLAMLEDQAREVLEDAAAGTMEKARTIGFLAGVMLKAIEAGNIAGRVEALEAALKARSDKKG